MLWGRYGLWKSCSGDGDHDTLLLVQVPAIFLLWAQASSVGLKKTLNRVSLYQLSPQLLGKKNVPNVLAVSESWGY